MKARKIKEGIYWVGAVDWDLIGLYSPPLEAINM